MNQGHHAPTQTTPGVPMIRIELQHEMFRFDRRVLLAAPDMTVTTLRLPNDIEVLALQTARLVVEILPFRGQQVWQAWVDGQPIGMRGMQDTPRAGDTILEAFGAFVYHCGLLGIAAPGPEDDHPLHGELPLARMDRAWLEVTDTPGGTQLLVGGQFDYSKAFRAHYRWSPSVALVAGQTAFEITARIENLMRSPLPFMYLAHPNFLPADDCQLAYSAPYGPDHVRVRMSVPGHLGDKPGYREQLAVFRDDPSLHHRLSKQDMFDPEVVFEIDYIADTDGFAHTLQVHPDGKADWVAHRPSDCPVAIRWISRTPEQDCIALAEPATSGLHGYTEERRRGHVPELAAGASWETKLRLGRLDPADARQIQTRIDALTGRGP